MRLLYRGCRLISWAVAVGLGGCAAIAPGSLPPGTPIAEARHTLFGPTAEYALPNGGTRLEFARGGFAKQTYMLDFDRNGALVTSRQVLTEANLQAITPGMTTDDVRMRYGRPVAIFGVRYQDEQVWNYRFEGGDCVVWQVSFSEATHRVTQSGVGTDLNCGGPNSRD